MTKDFKQMLIWNFEHGERVKPPVVLVYDTNWQWLMSACKKFDELSENERWVSGEAYVRLCDEIDDAVTRYDINRVFEKLANAVVWYNSAPQVVIDESPEFALNNIRARLMAIGEVKEMGHDEARSEFFERYLYEYFVSGKLKIIDPMDEKDGFEEWLRRRLLLDLKSIERFLEINGVS